MMVAAVFVMLLALGAHAQPPHRHGPPERRPGPHGPVSVSEAQAFAAAPAGTPDQLPMERLGVRGV